MADDQRLSTAEVDLLFAAQGAEMEALVALARAELSYQKQRRELSAMAERAADVRRETFSRVVEAHGFDPNHFEADIEEQCITPKSDVLALLQAAQNQDPKEEDRERRRSAAVSLRPVQEPVDENDG
jgi:hypothetical protein